MVDGIGSPISRFRLAVASSGALVAAALLGLIAWGVGLQLGFGDLDARTRALDAGFEETRALIRQNAEQIGRNAAMIAELGQKMEARDASTSAKIEALSASVDRFVTGLAEERQAAREDLREIRALTRENSLAIRDLLNQREGAGAPPGP